jgi:hypothetical protein
MIYSPAVRAVATPAGALRRVQGLPELNRSNLVDGIALSYQRLPEQGHSQTRGMLATPELNRSNFVDGERLPG